MLRPEERPGPRARSATAEEVGSAARGGRRLEGDRSEILDESIPLTNDKAFIRTVAHRVSFLEEKVPEAKKSWCLFNTTFQLFRYAVIPSLKTSGTYLNSVKNIMNMQSG